MLTWPSPLGGNIHIPPHPPRTLESLVHTWTTLLTPFITPRTPVALYRLPQSTTLPIFFALSRLRAIPVFLNHRYTLSDLCRALTTLPTSALLTIKLKTTHTQHIHPHVPLILTVTDTQSSPFYCNLTPSPSTSSSHIPPVTDLPEHTAAVFFTSGTTSTPKPVPLTFQNLTVQSHSKISYLRLSSSTTYLHLAPLYHLAGFSSSLAVILSKGTHSIPHNHHPSITTHAANLLSLIHQYHVTLLVAVPATLCLLLDPAHNPLPSVSTVLYGGSAPSDALLKHLHTTFPNAHILGAYGMTETASSLTLSPPNASSLPLPHVKLAILRDDHTILEEGHGEVLTKGPQVFPGYYGLQKQPFIKGWFKTGDIGKLSKQGLTLLGRKVEMIKSGGEKVYAGEVESVLMGHSAVREAAVVGLPDHVLGEAVAACVVLVADTGNDVIQTLRQFCRTALAHFKCPRWILATAQLPRNATGKVVKTRVRQILEDNFRIRAKL